MNLQDGVLLLDHHHQLLLSNGRARDYLSILSEMSDGQILTRLGTVELRDYLTDRQLGQLEQEISVPNHPERIFEAIFQPVDLEEDSCWIVILRDVSDRKRFERKIQAALEQARELSKLKSRVMRTVSHEYRSPLTTILVAAELLDTRFDRLNHKQRHHFLDRISQAGKYMTHLVDDMLLLDKTESGQLKFTPVKLDLKKICRDLVEEFRLQCEVTHYLIFEHEGATRNVYMDPLLLRQIFNNVLSNAIKYSPNGGEIKVKVVIDTANVEIWVQDQGIGIPTGSLDAIFDPFYRADNIDTIEGSGLGLNIAKKFMALHQGSIRVQPNHPVGTIFILEFPHC